MEKQTIFLLSMLFGLLAVFAPAFMYRHANEAWQQLIVIGYILAIVFGPLIHFMLRF